MYLNFEHHYKSFLRSFAQVMLQENLITGLLFLLGIGLNSLTMLLGSVLATMSALVVARLGNYDLTMVGSGLYGFNAALVGVAVFYFLPFSHTSLVLAIFGGAFSTVLMHFMLMRMTGIPAFTTPFILTTWLLLFFIDFLGLSLIDRSYSNAVTSSPIIDFFLTSLRGISQVMLQDYWPSGIVFLCALFIHSTKVAVWAILGSVLGMLIAISLSFSQEIILMGIYGFNGSLVAIALAKKYAINSGLIILAVLFSVLLTRFFEQVTIPALTAPFVISAWLVLGFTKVNT